MIVITTPTGDIGGQVLDQVVGAGVPVRVIARDPSAIPERTHDKIEVIVGSHGDADVVNRAFAGADTVFWVVPADPKAGSVTAAYVDFTRPAIEAIKRHGVKRLVDITALGRGLKGAGHAGHVTASLAMDDLFASTGVAFRALTMPSFMDNILMQLGPIKAKGMFFSPIDGDLKLPSCATRDIASVAAGLLLDPSWTGQGHIAVLGPADISLNEMAETMSEVLRKPVHFQQISLEAYRAGFIERGMSDAMAQAMTDMARAKNEGIDSGEPRSSDNTTPTSFRQWSEEVLKPALVQ